MQILRNIKSIIDGMPAGNVTRYFSIAEMENALSISEEYKRDFYKYLGHNIKGTNKVVIGFEDNEPCMDYYYIIADLDNGKVEYELANSAEFIASIEE